MEQMTLRISGMHCKSCAILIEEELKEKVGKVIVSFEKGRAQIEFDPGKISEKDIRKAIKSLGYGVS